MYEYLTIQALKMRRLIGRKLSLRERVRQEWEDMVEKISKSLDGKSVPKKVYCQKPGCIGHYEIELDDYEE